MSPLSKRSISDLLLAIGTCAFFYQSSGTPWSLLIVILFANTSGLKFPNAAGVTNQFSSASVSFSDSYRHTACPCPDCAPAINKISLSLIPSSLTSQKQEDFLFPCLLSRVSGWRPRSQGPQQQRPKSVTHSLSSSVNSQRADRAALL